MCSEELRLAGSWWDERTLPRQVSRKSSLFVFLRAAWIQENCRCNLDKLVKSQIRRMCHFDRREKSYLFNRLQNKDFSFHSKWQARETFYEFINLNNRISRWQNQLWNYGKTKRKPSVPQIAFCRKGYAGGEQIFFRKRALNSTGVWITSTALGKRNWPLFHTRYSSRHAVDLGHDMWFVRMKNHWPCAGVARIYLLHKNKI